MEDRWFIVWGGEELHVHRSWTGLETYSVRFESTASGARSSHAVVNSDLDQYPCGTPEREEAMLLWLIDVLPLGRGGPFPM